jgi:nitrate reductase delta subunit
MRAFAKPDPAHLQALERVRGWVRRRFGLGDDSTVMVAEVACGLPGCPPLETVIAFWSDGRRHHLKVFKPVSQVVEDDLPPGWLKPALAVPDDFQCTCC